MFLGYNKYIIKIKKRGKIMEITNNFKMNDSDYYWGVHSTLPDGSSELTYNDDSEVIKC